MSTSTPEEIKAEYASSLADLKFNSKPLINVLTMLAEENAPNAGVIVEAIETHLAKVSIICFVIIKPFHTRHFFIIQAKI